MFFVSMVVAALVVVTTLLSWENNPSKWATRALFAALANLILMAGINIMYALATWMNP